ncbi:MAG: hypothetical protein ACE5Z5_05790 [Candidatus Bathyarchaeia archaeon]
MAERTIPPEELWKSYDVLIGGMGALSHEALTGGEVKAFDKFGEDSIDVLEKISPEVAKDFSTQVPLFKSVAEVFKSKVDKPFGGILPSSGQFGVGLIIPQDIRYVSTPSATEPAYTDYALNSWNLALTAGAAIHILGDGTNYYKPKPTVGQRCAIVIMKNGIVEVGTSPSLNQIVFKTERITYPAFTVHPLVDQPIEKDLLIYRYNFPAAMPLFYDFGTMLDAMPTVSRTCNVRLIGVIFYEYDHRKALAYIS